jgi:hypothetical protein
MIVNYHGRHIGRNVEEKRRDAIKVLKQLRKTASKHSVRQFTLIGDLNVDYDQMKQALAADSVVSFAQSANYEVSWCRRQG